MFTLYASFSASHAVRKAKAMAAKDAHRHYCGLFATSDPNPLGMPELGADAVYVMSYRFAQEDGAGNRQWRTRYLVKINPTVMPQSAASNAPETPHAPIIAPSDQESATTHDARQIDTPSDKDAASLYKEKKTTRIVRGCYRNMIIRTFTGEPTEERYNQFLDTRFAQETSELQWRGSKKNWPAVEIDGRLCNASYEFIAYDDEPQPETAPQPAYITTDNDMTINDETDDATAPAPDPTGDPKEETTMRMYSDAPIAQTTDANRSNTEPRVPEISNEIIGSNTGERVPLITVRNLATLETQKYSCEPRAAVIAAYAQSRGDYNTWDYEAKYGHLAEEVKGIGRHFACGDFCATVPDAEPEPRHCNHCHKALPYHAPDCIAWHEMSEPPNTEPPSSEPEIIQRSLFDGEVIPTVPDGAEKFALKTRGNTDAASTMKYYVYSDKAGKMVYSYQYSEADAKVSAYEAKVNGHKHAHYVARPIDPVTFAKEIAVLKGDSAAMQSDLLKRLEDKYWKLREEMLNAAAMADRFPDDKELDKKYQAARRVTNRAWEEFRKARDVARALNTEAASTANTTERVPVSIEELRRHDTIIDGEGNAYRVLSNDVKTKYAHAGKLLKNGPQTTRTIMVNPIDTKTCYSIVDNQKLDLSKQYYEYNWEPQPVNTDAEVPDDLPLEPSDEPIREPEYTVIETAMFPNRFKVQAMPPLRDDNAGCNYFATQEEAEKVAAVRNGKEPHLSLVEPCTCGCEFRLEFDEKPRRMTVSEFDAHPDRDVLGNYTFLIEYNPLPSYAYVEIVANADEYAKANPPAAVPFGDAATLRTLRPRNHPLMHSINRANFR